MAITAHFEESPENGEQSALAPRAARRTLRLDVEGALPSGDGAWVSVHNISATGLLIECADNLAVGETIAVDLPEAGMQSARVIWTSGKIYGCRFEASLSPAMLAAAQLRSAVAETAGETPAQDTHASETFAARLQRLRKARGLTMAQLGAELGVSKPTVWAWEQGRARPVDSRIEALAEALGADPSELVPGRDSPALRDLLARSREQIAEAFGTSPDNVRIMIEL